MLTLLTAQKVDTRWGKISKDEAKLATCTFDTSASAVILFDVGKMYFRNSYAIIERHRRIKILDNTAMDYANVTLPYIHQDGLQNIRDVRAQTIKIVDGKTESISVKNDQIFDEKNDEYWAQVRFALPSVSPGDIIEYQYSFSTENLYFIEPWFFQNELPTITSELSVKPASYLAYNIVKFGKQLGQLKNTENKWTLHNIPGYASEQFIFHPEDYAEQIHFQLLSYDTQRDAIRGGGIETINVLQDWKTLGEEVLDRCDDYFNNRKKLSALVEQLTSSADTEEEKVQKLYDYVIDQYQWNRYWGIRTSQTFNQLQKTRSGNSAELNLFFIAMLKEAGLTADPVLLSTRHHGKVVQSFPLLSQFNHLVTRLEVGSDVFFADAALGTPGQAFYLLPRENLNFKGFLLRNGSFEWLDVPAPDHSKTSSAVKIDLRAQNMKIEFRLEGYAAIDAIANLKGKDAKASPFEQVPEFGDAVFRLAYSDFESTIDTDGKLSLYTEFPIEEPDQALIYFSPLNWSRFTNVPFKKRERYFPLELDYPFTDNLTVTITLPDDYQVASTPKNSNVT